ncbi:oligosaccharide repeat unit polymerase [Yoonia sp. 2307UL14-13]|uniref:oligosaccharide repeat unit polymerase n=1 Tax=Yoonia sp. 2307UL14-13 TaxID=3126506 RepID=UPI0030A38DAB
MDAILIITMAAICTALPLWLGQRYGRIAWVSPLHLVGYFCLFGFLLKVCVYTARPDLAFYRRFVENPWGDQLGAIYLTFFVLMLCAGYCSAIRSVDGNIPPAAQTMARGLARTTPLFLLAFGITAATIGLILRARGAGVFDPGTLATLNSAKQIDVNADGVGATLAGLKTLFIVPKCAFVLLMAHAMATGRCAARAQAVTLGLLLIAIALISGDRFELVELAIYTLATFVIMGGRIGARFIVKGAIGLVILGTLSAYMTALRLEDSADGDLFTQIVGSTYFLDINAAIMVADRVQTTDMLWGESYTWWTFGWVPRAFWADKPAVGLGVFFKRDIMGLYTGGAFNVTGPGEAFINFGWGGVGIGIILGWLYRQGEVLLLSPTNTLRHGAFILYPLIFYPFVQATLQSSFSAFIVGAAAQMLLLALMIPVFLTRYRPHMTRRLVHAH